MRKYITVDNNSENTIRHSLHLIIWDPMKPLKSLSSQFIIIWKYRKQA